MKIFQKVFAAANSEEQAEMFNEIGRLLYMNCQSKSTMGMENQLCYIADELDIHGQRLVVELGKFVELKNEKI